MPPSYFFRIDEIRANPNAPPHVDQYGYWIPGTNAGENYRLAGGKNYFCNRQQISVLDAVLPPGSSEYSTFSVYYCDQLGFMVLKGDVTDPVSAAGEAWKPLTFDYPGDYPDPDEVKDASSFLTNAGHHKRLYVQRPDQQWPSMLLPSMYHAVPKNHIPVQQQNLGGLKGELPILLALIALSTLPSWVSTVLPASLVRGIWAVHRQYKQPWEPQRGVVVSVHTLPAQYGAGSEDAQIDELMAYENGKPRKYFT